ncbi:unnamed protein product [Heterobilharzia americana]|nr:unnamed protein product [Heterobilharzia americana]
MESELTLDIGCICHKVRSKDLLVLIGGEMNLEEPLPPGWEMRLDTRTGRWYFVDHNTRSTQWEHPVTNKEYSPQPNGTNVQNSEQQVNNPHISNCESIIADVMSKARALRPEIDRFEGTSQSKEYKCLMENMEQLILNLDAVNTNGNEDFRNVGLSFSDFQSKWSAVVNGHFILHSDLLYSLRSYIRQRRC